MTRITCDCKLCKTNAKTVGAPFPLAADVPDALASKLGTETHGIVYSAHEPNFIGEQVRKRTGAMPVTA